jgi:hypothetical protein
MLDVSLTMTKVGGAMDFAPPLNNSPVTESENIGPSWIARRFWALFTIAGIPPPCSGADIQTLAIRIFSA